MLHRNQDELDRIRCFLEAAALLSFEDADLLSFHLGDLCDAFVEFPEEIVQFEMKLSGLGGLSEVASIDAALTQTGYLRSALEHLSYHIDGYTGGDSTPETRTEGALTQFRKLEQAFAQVPPEIEAQTPHYGNERLKRVSHLIDEAQLLNHQDAESLTFHLGRLWNSADEFPVRVTGFGETLSQSSASPRAIQLETSRLRTELQDISSHIAGALIETNKLWDKLFSRLPETEPS